MSSLLLEIWLYPLTEDKLPTKAGSSISEHHELALKLTLELFMLVPLIEEVSFSILDGSIPSDTFAKALESEHENLKPNFEGSSYPSITSDAEYQPTSSSLLLLPSANDESHPLKMNTKLNKLLNRIKLNDRHYFSPHDN